MNSVGDKRVSQGGEHLTGSLGVPDVNDLLVVAMASDVIEIGDDIVLAHFLEGVIPELVGKD